MLFNDVDAVQRRWLLFEEFENNVKNCQSIDDAIIC